MGVDRLCFGTSTFAAGRLRPDKDSEPGIAALRAAVSAGVRLIHSNPKLRTQWAIRQALAEAAGAEFQHIVKAEAPLDASPGTVRANVVRAINDSCDTLGVSRLHAVTVEIDLKRTRDQVRLTEPRAVTDFYTTAAEATVESGLVSQAIAYCHSPAHLVAALNARGVHGIAAQYNVAEPWPALFLDSIERLGLKFVGMSPLRRGALAQGTQPASVAVRWAVADPRVSAIVVTMSSPPHVHHLIEALQKPLSAETVHEVTHAWLEAASSHPSPEKKWLVTDG